MKVNPNLIKDATERKMAEANGFASMDGLPTPLKVEDVLEDYPKAQANVDDLAIRVDLAENLVVYLPINRAQRLWTALDLAFNENAIGYMKEHEELKLKHAVELSQLKQKFGYE